MATTPWYDFNDTFHGYITQSLGPGTDTPHYANDVQTPFHTPLTSLWDGTVTKADYQPWGGEIFIQLKNGLQEYFYHLDDIDVKVGQQVNTSTLLGLSGGQNSGGDHNTSPIWSTGPHTHVGLFDGTFPGGIPHGPDITPYITDATNGKLNVGGLGNGGAPSSSGSSGGCTFPSWVTVDSSGNPSGVWAGIASAYPGGLTAFRAVMCTVSNPVGVAAATSGVDLTGINSLANTLGTDSTAVQNALTDKNWWLRAGIFAGGALLLILGLWLFIGGKE